MTGRYEESVTQTPNDPHSARLRTALEMKFGPAGAWPLKIKAAQVQMLTLSAMAPICYRPYLQAAVEAIYDQAAINPRIPRHPSEFLQRAVTRRFGTGPNPEVDLAWSIV